MTAFTYPSPRSSRFDVFEGETGLLEPAPECPERLAAIRRGLDGCAEIRTVETLVSFEEMKTIHDPSMIDFFAEMDATPEDERPVFPDSFPEREAPEPLTLTGRIGYFCTDTQTPFITPVFEDVRASAACALEAARFVADGGNAFAACRPPGHHAGRAFYGGYCYLNNTALAAELLSHTGRVAVLDVDYHHGNGTQDCFYDSDRVFTVSIHADTRYAYPFYSGHDNETGAGDGRGFNLNLPLGPESTVADWFAALEQALEEIRRFGPDFLVLAFGADTYINDPVGGLSLETSDYAKLGRRIAQHPLPTLIVQEGGYVLEALPNIVGELVGGFQEKMAE